MSPHVLTRLEAHRPAFAEIVHAVLNRHPHGIDRGSLELVAAQHGFEPHEFTKHIRSLVHARVLQPPYEVAGTLEGRRSHIYSTHPLGVDDLQRWHQRIVDRELLLPAHEQRNAGEQYARALIGRAKREDATWFGRIPQKWKLGNFGASRNRTADLVVDYDLAGAHFSSMFVESKNLRERIDISSSIIPKLMESALAANMLPVLFAAHMSPRAETFCHDVGIAVLHLGRRIVSKSKRKRVRELWADANDEFHFVRLNRIHTEPIDALTRRHIDTLRCADWVSEADARWHANRSLVPWAIDHLYKGKWQSVAARFTRTSSSRTELQAA